MEKVTGKKVAVLATNGVEQSEFEKPVQALKEAGAEVTIVSLKSGTFKAWDQKNWGKEISVDKTVDSAKAAAYDALVLPGGVMNPDTLRTNKDAVQFVKDFMTAGKPVAAICHGPWMLVEADVVRGKKLTSYPSIKTDIINAGGNWVDQEVVTDMGLVTSRNPNDLPAFCKKMLEEIGEGVHNRKKVAEG